ncbi:MAG: hypothetical protein ACREIT_11585, partial [Tepidisphaeraceae bacterium]
IDQSVKVELPPGSSPAHLDRLFKELETIDANDKTQLAQQLHGLAERLPRRSLVILLSDLWLEPGDLIKALQHLRYRKHQAMVLHLLDKAEIELPYDRQVTLQDLETNEKLQIDPADIREVYKQQVGAYLTGVRRACVDSDIEYHSIYVDQPYERALIELLSRRS